MLPSLTRTEFPDRPWAAADLDAAAEFWLRLYEAAAGPRGFSPDPDHTTELRLRGFPRHEADAVAAELARRTDGSDFAVPQVWRPDPDTVALASGGRGRADERPPAGLGLPLLGGPPFDGLYAEFRFRAGGQEGRVMKTGRAAATLVLVGEVRAGRLVLKAVWRCGAFDWEDAAFAPAPWPAEAAFLAALEEFGRTGEVPQRLAKEAFQNRETDRMARGIARLVATPFGRPRLFGLAWRAGVFGAAFAAGVAAVYLWAVHDVWAVAAGLALPLVWVALVFYSFARYEYARLVRLYRPMRRWYDRYYAGPPGYAAVARADADARFGSPWLRKYTAEAEADGFAHAGDVLSTGSGASLFRIFHAPDGVTYLALLFVTAVRGESGPDLRSWPAVVSAQAQTFFPGGGRADSVSSQRFLSLKGRSDPDTGVRSFPAAADPDDLLREHARVVAELADRTGTAPLRHEPFDRYVRRQEAIHEDERQQYADRPYSWADHLRWYLQWPRRA